MDELSLLSTHPNYQYFDFTIMIPVDFYEEIFNLHNDEKISN